MAATSFTVPCPSCESGVPVKARGLIGKKIDCPKCKYRFTVPDPDAPEDDDAPVEPTPKKKKAKGSPMVLVGVLLGVFAVGVLGVGGYFLFGTEETPSSANKGTTQAPRPAPQPAPAPAPDGGTGKAPDGGDPTNDKQPEQAVPDAAPGIGLPGEVKQPTRVERAADADKPVAADKMKDPTNLLPGSTSAVVRINMDRVMQSPALYGSFFDKQTHDFFKNSMTFDLNTVSTFLISVVEPDRDPFVVIRTKTPFSSRALLNPRVMELQPGPQGAIQGREYFVIKSNPFVHAVSRALSTESLLGEAGLPVTEDDKKRWKEKPLGLTIYDSQTLVVAEVGILERFLHDLDKNGDPPFITELTPADATSTPPAEGGAAPPEGGEGEGGATGIDKSRRRQQQGGGERQPPEGAPGGPGGGLTPRPNPGSPGGGPEAGGPGGGGPGGQGRPGAGGGQPRPTKLFTSVPTYRTIKSELKFLLNRLEEDEKNPPALVYAEILDQRLYNRDLSAYEQIGIIMQAIVQNVKLVGLAINTLNREKFQGQMLFQYVSADDAQRSVNQSIVPLLNLLRGPLGLLLGSNVDLRTPSGGGQGQGGFGGSRSAPGGGEAEIGDPSAGGAPGGPPGGRGAGGDPRGFGRTPGDPSAGGPGGFGGGPPGAGTQGGTGSLSSFTVSLNDTLASVDMDIVWNAERYTKLIQTAIQSVANQLKGRMNVLSGETTWHTLAAGIPKMLSTKQAFPHGTLARDSNAERYGLQYPPEHRSSFLVEILPFIGKGGLRSTIQEKKFAWYAKENLPAAQTWVPEFLVPTYPQTSWRASHPLAEGKSLGGTNYVGLSGLGLDSARLNPADPAAAKRVGITGYDWGSKPDQVTDGLAQTAYMIQVPPGFNRPWIAGGGATLMGVDDTIENPVSDFVHRTPDGKRGTYVLMGDGSVRWVPEGIDPAVFKAMVTRAGGETVDLDKAAPKQQPKSRDIELGGSKGDVVKAAPKAAPPAAPDKWAPEVEAELQKLQGRWTITSLVLGKQRLNEEQLKVLKGGFVDFEERRLTLTMKGEVVMIDEITKIDPQANPKTMETKQLQGPQAGKTGISAYEFVGTDVLRVRVTMDGKSAPKAVEPPSDDSTDGYFELKRKRE